MSTRDFTELDRQIDNAEAHAINSDAPGRKWDQRFYFATENVGGSLSCEAYGCLAGNTLLDHHGSVEGYRQWQDEQWRTGAPDSDTTWDTGWNAGKVLGLTYDEAEAFFEADNTIGVIRKLQADLHEGIPVDLELQKRYLHEEKELVSA